MYLISIVPFYFKMFSQCHIPKSFSGISLFLMFITPVIVTVLFSCVCVCISVLLHHTHSSCFDYSAGISLQKRAADTPSSTRPQLQVDNNISLTCYSYTDNKSRPHKNVESEDSDESFWYALSVSSAEAGLQTLKTVNDEFGFPVVQSPSTMAVWLWGSSHSLCLSAFPASKTSRSGWPTVAACRSCSGSRPQFHLAFKFCSTIDV